MKTLWLTPMVAVPIFVLGTTIAPAAAASEHSAPPALIAGVTRLPVRDAGRALANTRVDLAVVLKYHNENQLEALIRAQSDPGSPTYGRFLTTREFRDSFAPTAAEHARVLDALQRAGFTVTHTFPNRTVIDVSAPAPVVERYFNTEIHRVTQAGVPHYANVRPAYLPAELRDTVYGIGGFDNMRIAEPTYVRGTPLRTDTKLGPPLQAPDTGLGPYAFASAYDFPVQHAIPGGPAGATYDGKGHSTGIAIDSDYTETDLSAFLSYFGITRTGPPTTRVSVDGGGGIGFDAVETTLDTETIVGTAPGTKLYLYLVPSLLYTSIIDLYNKVVSDSLVDALNSSFSGCETNTFPTTFPKLSNHIAMQGAALGITFNASTGDNGTFQCTFPGPGGVGTPASGPFFSAIGGTTLIITPQAKYRTELGWSGSGGGFSAVFAVPPFQSGITGLAGTGRNLPDVSFDANPGSGAAFYYSGAWNGPIGGTSLASPLFSALVTEVNQVHGAGKRSGHINAAIYNRFKHVGYGPVFRDVIGGNNGFYNAVAGYDQVTGIGSIVGWAYAL